MTYTYVCKICDQRFDQIPDTAEKIAPTVFRFEDQTVHILSRRKFKPVEPGPEIETKIEIHPDECRAHWTLTQYVTKADCKYCQQV